MTPATAGGQVYVARLAAENLNLGRLTLNASDPRMPLCLDVHKLAELFLGNAPPTTAAAADDK